MENPEFNRKTFESSLKVSTFQQTYSEGLTIFLVSNKLQESIKTTDILASLSTDHSSTSFTLKRLQIIAKAKCLYIFNF